MKTIRGNFKWNDDKSNVVFVADKDGKWEVTSSHDEVKWINPIYKAGIDPYQNDDEKD